MCQLEDGIRLTITQRTNDHSETQSGSKSSDVRIGLMKKCELVKRSTGGRVATRHTYLILGKFKISFDGFGNQWLEGKPRQMCIQSLPVSTHGRC